MLDTELEDFISHIIQAKNRGISLITNLTVEPNWSFGQAVFFSGTVLTTIGYGHVSPLSTGGKIFCIIYAMFGIPMTLIMISACVERLLLLTNWIYDSMKRMRCFVNSFNMINLQLLTYTHLAVVFLFILTTFFLIPAAIFSSIEPDWDYLDGLYYCFISLSTIGLGLYSMPTVHWPVTRILTIISLFLTRRLHPGRLPCSTVQSCLQDSHNMYVPTRSNLS